MKTYKNIFVTGISTDVGKTIVSAILLEALQADYWKPIQSGDLHNSDTDKIQKIISNSKTKFHKNSYSLNMPISPHAAADIDGVKIDIEKINRPIVQNHLIIEGAGGLLVPLNDKNTIADLIQKDDIVILVSKHYLGSINHTLLSLQYLLNRNIKPFLIFFGDETITSENIIQKFIPTLVIGRLGWEKEINFNMIHKYAEKWKLKLQNIIQNGVNI